KEQYGATDPKSMWLRMIAGGGGGGLTFEQPELNIVRGAYYALISALSGTQTMALCSYDEAYTIPTEYSARLSLRTMQLLTDEMGLCDTVDPLAGSYYIETLTNEMRQEIEREMEEVDQAGGIVKLVSSGEIQSKVSAQAYQMQRDIQSGKFRKVGVNRHRIDEEEREVEFHSYQEEDAQAQIESLKQIRRERDQSKADLALTRVKDDAQAGLNVMPAIMEAVKAYATVGEITTRLVEVYGCYQEPIRF
ncbi:MAG: methylmalonyl-CoA mutase family protein, partial [Arenicellales bacterium]|nr:methylmalonyl-CoA mutase family protein [Arenicellales bacterium]